MKVSVIVHPNSKNPRVEKDLLDTIHVYVNEPPLEGKANMAVIQSLTRLFSCEEIYGAFTSWREIKK